MEISRELTLRVLDSLGNISLEFIEELNSFPEIILKIFENQFQHGEVPPSLQSKYLVLLDQYSPHLVVHPLKNYKFKFSYIQDTVNQLNNVFGKIILKTKLGLTAENAETLKE